MTDKIPVRYCTCCRKLKPAEGFKTISRIVHLPQLFWAVDHLCKECQG